MPWDRKWGRDSGRSARFLRTDVSWRGQKVNMGREETKIEIVELRK